MLALGKLVSRGGGGKCDCLKNRGKTKDKNGGKCLNISEAILEIIKIRFRRTKKDKKRLGAMKKGGESGGEDDTEGSVLNSQKEAHPPPLPFLHLCGKYPGEGRGAVSLWLVCGKR